MLDDDEKWAALSVRFFGDALDLEAVTAVVSLPADVAAKAGDHMGGDQRCAAFKRDIWVSRFRSPEESRVPELIRQSVEHLEARGEPLRALAMSEDVTAELIITYTSGNGQGGFTLSPELLGRVSSIGFGLSLNAYVSESDDLDG